MRVEEGGKPHRRGGRPTSHTNCKQTRWLAGAAASPSNQERESLEKWWWKKTPQERGKTHFPHEL
jgi:hypothetical protein